MPEEELYDLETDPHEIKNLATSPEHQAALKKLRAILENWIKETGDHLPDPDALPGAKPSPQNEKQVPSPDAQR